MKKERKYDYVKVIQQFITDCGWADVTFYDKDDKEQMKDLRSDLNSYRKYDKGPFRVISRRVPHGAVLHA